MTTNKYYALWHHCYVFGNRDTNIISEKPETLLQQHNDHIKNPESCWHNYKENVSEMIINPIECYTYNNKKLEPYNDSHIKDDSAFYAVNYNEDDNEFGIIFYKDVVIKLTYNDGITIIDSTDYELEKGPFLVYLSKTDYNKWNECHELYKKSDCIMDPELPIFFYTNWTSDDPVLPDVYYQESVMNA